jgi:hypothetical protein
MYNVTVRGISNSTNPTDEQWGACLACAVVERRRQAVNLTRSSTCETCMTRYCWDAADTSGVAANAANNPNQVFTDDAASLLLGRDSAKIAIGLAGLVAAVAMLL